MAKKPPRPMQKASKPRKRLLDDTWFLEIASLSLSICAFIVIVVLLAHYDGHRQFDWNGVTLNAVISVLATIARIGIVLPVAESLAQWKWMNFSKTYDHLSEFNLIDDASRGSRGSLLLLWEKRSWTLTSIGAWIMLLSAAIEPFFQQILLFEDTVSFRDNKDVSITYATRWNGGSEQSSKPANSYESSEGNGVIENVFEYGSVSGLNLDFQAQAAVLFGLSSDGSHVNQQLKTSCPSGNCTWPLYMTLGVCSSCNDVTSQLVRSQKVGYSMADFTPDAGAFVPGEDPANITSYSLPNGLYLENRDPGEGYVAQAPSVIFTGRSNLAPSQTVSFRNATTLLWSAAMLRTSDKALADTLWVNPKADNVQATECGIYLCIKKYNSTLLNGQLNENFTEIASTREPNSFEPNFNDDGPIDGYDFSGVTPNVDALYDNATYFPRDDLSIAVPPNVAEGTNFKNVRRVNASQAGIDTLSHYISTIFDDGTFTNRTLGPSPGVVCSLNGTNTTCGVLGNVTGMVIETSFTDASSKTVFTNSYYPPVMQVLWASENLTTTFAALAESITVAMRRQQSGVSTISGQLGISETLLRVRWPWITLPLLCLVVSAIFLTLSILEATADATPLWKSGAMAYLVHGPDQQAREKIQHADLISEMGEVAEGVKVRLHRGDDGVLMLRSEAMEMKPAKLSEEHEHEHEHGPEHDSGDEVELGNVGSEGTSTTRGYQRI